MPGKWIDFRVLAIVEREVRVTLALVRGLADDGITAGEFDTAQSGSFKAAWDGSARSNNRLRSAESLATDGPPKERPNPWDSVNASVDEALHPLLTRAAHSALEATLEDGQRGLVALQRFLAANGYDLATGTRDAGIDPKTEKVDDALTVTGDKIVGLEDLSVAADHINALEASLGLANQSLGVDVVSPRLGNGSLERHTAVAALWDPALSDH